jgi:hypothetical protein
MKRYVFVGGLVLLSGFTAVTAACGSSPNEMSGSDGSPGDTSSGDSGGAGLGMPTFTNVYGEILSVSCGATGLFNCHGSPDSGVQQGAQPNSALDFSSPETAYHALYNVMAMASLAIGETATTSCGVTPDSGATGHIRVVPGNAQESLLYEKIENPSPNYMPPCGMRMPLNHNTMGIDFGVPFVPLSQSQITLIADWINAGALNN